MALFLTALMTVGWGSQPVEASGSSGKGEVAPVKVLSYRPADVMAPLLARFTKETGIPTELDVRRGEGVVEYFQKAAEGPRPDVIVVVDAQRLAAVAETGALRPLPPRALDRIPEAWRDSSGMWAGLSWRVRAVLQPSDGPYVGYQELLGKLSEGKRVCVREGDHVYNRGLTAWLRQREGDEFARAWLETVHGKREPISGGDRDQIRAMAQGLCDYAVVNHYYFARMVAEEEDAALRDRLASLRFGPAPGHGSHPLHANVSGIALTREAGNPHGAEQLAMWLMSPENQAAYAKAVWEFPAAWPNGGAVLAEAMQPFAHLRASAPFPAELARDRSSAR